MGKEQLEKKIRNWDKVRKVGGAIAIGSIMGMFGIVTCKAAINDTLFDAQGMEKRLGQCIVEFGTNSAFTGDCRELAAEYRELRDSAEYKQAVETEEFTTTAGLYYLLPLFGLGAIGALTGAVKRDKYKEKRELYH